MSPPAIAFVPAANGVQIAVIPIAAPSPGGQLPISALTTWDGTPFDIETLATVQGQADALAALAAIAEALAGTLTVTGSVDVGTPAVTQSGAWSVSITGTLPGFASPPAVSVNNFPATQPVSGTVSVGNLPADPPTATNQTTGNTTLASILSALAGGLPAALGTAGGLKAALVDIGTAATAALQTTGNTTLTTIAAALAGTLKTQSDGGSLYSTDDVGVNGWRIVTGACTFVGFTGDNPLRGSAYLHVFDSASLPSNGDKPGWILAATTASNGTASFNAPARGIKLTAGCVVIFSTTKWTLTKGSASGTAGVGKAVVSV